MYLTEDVGTTVYLSPEQVNHAGLYDFKVDVWALGCWLYYLSTYKAPFSGTNFALLSYNIVNEEPKDLPSEYSEELKTFISKALTKNPKERPPALELFLWVPATIINNYSMPKQPAGSTTFMNPTKSTIGRQKSSSRQNTILEAYKPSKTKIRSKVLKDRGKCYY